MASQETDPIHREAYELLRFLLHNIAPDEAWAQGREDEWPLDLIAVDEDTAIAMNLRLDRLGRALRESGWDAVLEITPETDDPTTQSD